MSFKVSLSLPDNCLLANAANISETEQAAFFFFFSLFNSYADNT